MLRRARVFWFTSLSVIFLAFVSGCPHRSPLWSPDGKHLLVLAGPASEEIDSPASELWLVDVDLGSAYEIPPPEPDARFLAGVWLDAKTFLVATAHVEGDEVREGSETWWQRAVGDGRAWQRLDLPPPSGSRATKRLPVLLEASGELPSTLIYPTGWDDTVAVSLDTGKETWRGTLTEVTGPGPDAGFIAQRENDSGGLELVSFARDFRERWSMRFSELRDALARNRGLRPVDIVFNDASTCHLPFADPETRDRSLTRPAKDDSGEEKEADEADAKGERVNRPSPSAVEERNAVEKRSTGVDPDTRQKSSGEDGENAAKTQGDETSWVGVVLCFSDVSWHDGMRGYYVRLGADDGHVIDFAGARGLPGKPASRDGRVWGVTAPESKAGRGVSLSSYDLATGELARDIPLDDIPKSALHGYSADPLAARMALVISRDRPVVWIYARGAEPRRIPLEPSE